MALNARTATATDFDKAAQQHANAFWVLAIAAAITYWFLGWWALIPGCLAVLKILQSISATSAAGQLRKGTYRLPNPNNGLDS